MICISTSFNFHLLLRMGSKAALLLWFYYFCHCVCMYVLVKLLILDSHLANYFGKELSY